jgi:hypothetical protein
MNFSVLILIFSFFSFEITHPVFKEKIQIIRKNQSVELFAIDDFPTKKTEQDTTANYIEDYKILREITLDKDAKIKLRDEVSESKNYNIINQKSCPQIAKYALRFRKKDEYIIIVISPDPCSKSLIFSSDKNLNATNVELSSTNTLEPLLKELAK